MAFCSVRNATPNPLTLPMPYGGILPQGNGIVIPDSAANVSAAFGSPRGAGIEIVALPDNFSGAVAGAAFLGGISRERVDSFTRENVAASLTDSPLETALAGATSLTQQVVTRAGSIVGIWLLSSIVGAGAALALKVSVNGVASTVAIASLAIGQSKVTATFVRNLIPIAAGDTVGMMISTPAGWTAVTADIIAGFEIES